MIESQRDAMFIGVIFSTMATVYTLVVAAHWLPIAAESSAALVASSVLATVAVAVLIVSYYHAEGRDYP